MKTLVAALLLGALLSDAQAADITRYSNPPPSPIARAVEVPPGMRVIYHSGFASTPADPKAPAGSAEYWGDTKTQALGVFARLQDSLKSMGLGFGDVVKMTVFLVGDPARGGRMDFAGFMEAYSQHFGTKEQPNLPARSTVQVAGLVQPGMMVEIELVLAKP